jgi:hypothetical protein
MSSNPSGFAANDSLSPISRKRHSRHAQELVLLRVRVGATSAPWLARLHVNDRHAQCIAQNSPHDKARRGGATGGRKSYVLNSLAVPMPVGRRGFRHWLPGSLPEPAGNCVQRRSRCTQFRAPIRGLFGSPVAGAGVILGRTRSLSQHARKSSGARAPLPRNLLASAISLCCSAVNLRVSSISRRISTVSRW